MVGNQADEMICCRRNTSSPAVNNLRCVLGFNVHVDDRPVANLLYVENGARSE